MNTNTLRTLSFVALCVAALLRPALAQSEKPQPPGNKDGQPSASLSDAANQSRVAAYADSTKGQVHAEDAKQFETVARAFISSISPHDAKKTPTHCTVPFYFQDERIVEREAMTSRLQESSFPGVFALAKDREFLLVDTLEQLEALIEKQVPNEVRKGWAEHTAAPSRIALVSGGPMVVGLSLRKKDGEYSVSGLLFAFFPKGDAPILKAIKGRLLDEK